ncbi:MAG: TfoX/Sxy family protein [Pseudomonadota bacterium]
MATDRNYETALQRYRVLVAASPGIELKGKKMPYTSMNGNMFSFLAPDGVLCLRLSSAECTEFMQAHGTEPVMQYGSVMRDYVAVPDALVTDDDALAALFRKSLENAQSLKAKPTKR